MPIRVTVWHEHRHEKKNATVAEIYPQGMHGAIASYLRKCPGLQVRKATLGGPEVPYKGDPGISTVSAARSGADTIVETDMRDGKVVSTNTMTTSDGKKMALIFVDKLRNSTQKLTATKQ